MLSRITAGLLFAALIPASSPRGQTTCGTAVATDRDGLRLIDAAGSEIRRVAATGFAGAVVVDLGPRIVLIDATGTRIVDRRGFVLGAGTIANTGQAQNVVHGDGRLIVIDADRVRFFDLDRNQLGGDVRRTGTGRQSAVVGGGMLVVIDDDRVRFFDRAGNPVGAPIVLRPGQRAGVRAMRRGAVLIESDRVTLYGGDGNPITGPIATQGTATVVVDGDRIVITDDRETHVFGDDGLRRTTIAKTGSRRQQVKVSGDRIVVIDDDRVRVFDRNGFPIGGPVVNNGSSRQTVEITGTRIVITDDSRTEIFDRRDMNRITTVTKTGSDRQQVVADDAGITIIDQDRVRLFGNDGLQRGAAIMRSGNETQQVVQGGDRVLVVDDSEVRVVDRSGRILRTIPVSNVIPSGVQLFERSMTITDGQPQRVRIFDRDGVQQGQTVGVGLGVQHVQPLGPSRLVIADDNRIRLFGSDGVQVGATHLTRGEPEVGTVCWQPGRVAEFGRGCHGLDQSVLGQPAAGVGAAYAVAGATPNSLAVLIVGLSTSSWSGLPLPLDLGPAGAPGCIVYTDAVATLPVAVGGNGSGLVEVTFPFAAGVVGGSFHTQFVAPTAANALGLRTSDAATTTVGSGS